MAIADIAEVSSSHAQPKALRIERRFTRDGVHPYDEIEWELRDSAIPGESGNVFEQKGVEVPKFWSQTATNVVASKYFRGKLGSPIREWSVKQMVDRVVDTIARAGELLGEPIDRIGVGLGSGEVGGNRFRKVEAVRHGNLSFGLARTR